MATRLSVALVFLACGWTAGAVAAQESRGVTQRPEELEPHVIGTKGTTAIGFGGYLDRTYSSERVLPTNYTIQIDAGRFVATHVVVRGGLSGSGSVGGGDPEDRPTGLGAPALHGSAGVFYYLKPQSMWSPYAGAEYWMQLTQRGADDKGAAVGTLGLEGAVSRRLAVFLEGGYGLGLTGPKEETNRAVARVGMRLKF